MLLSYRKDIFSIPLSSSCIIHTIGEIHDGDIVEITSPIFSSINYTSRAINMSDKISVPIKFMDSNKYMDSEGNVKGTLMCDDNDISNMYVNVDDSLTIDILEQKIDKIIENLPSMLSEVAVIDSSTDVDEIYLSYYDSPTINCVSDDDMTDYTALSGPIPRDDRYVSYYDSPNIICVPDDDTSTSTVSSSDRFVKYGDTNITINCVH